MDARQLAKQFLGRYLGRYVAVGEACVLRQGGASGPELLARVVGTSTLDQEAQAECLVPPHCYRGLVAPDTAVYATAEAEAGAGRALRPQTLASGRVPVRLLDARWAQAPACLPTFLPPFLPGAQGAVASVSRLPRSLAGLGRRSTPGAAR